MGRTWLITGVSSGFGLEMTTQLLKKGDCVIGSVRNYKAVETLITKYPTTFDCHIVDMVDQKEIQDFVNAAFMKHQHIDVVISNAGYGLFGAAEELNDEEVDHIIATNLTGAIKFIRSTIPYLRKQGGGRIIQISSYGGQVAYPSNSMYHATKFGIEGFCEALAQEVEQFHIGVSIIEPGGARTQFRYGSAKVAQLMEEYASCHDFLDMLNPKNGLAPGDPVKMAQQIIDSVELHPAPLRLLLGTKALQATIERLETRLQAYKDQKEIAKYSDMEDVI